MRPARTTVVHFLTRVGVSVVGFFGTLFLTRHLGAEVYGVYVVALSIVYWTNIPTTAIGSAIKKRVSGSGEKGKFLGAGYLLNFIVMALVAGLFLLFDGWLTEYVGRDITVLLIVMVLSHLLFGATTAALQGQQKVGHSGVLIFVERVIRVGSQVALIVVGFQLTGALIGYTIAAFVAAIFGLMLFDVWFSLPGRRHFERLFEYAQYSWLGSIKGKVSGPAIDVIFLNFFVSTSLIGVYQVSWNIASLLVMVSGSVQSTLFPEISKLSSEDRYEDVRQLIEEGLIFAGIFAIPGLFGGVLIGPRVLRIYGSTFGQGGTILLILIAARVFSTYSTQFTNALNGLDRPDVAFRLNLGLIVSNVALNLVLIPMFGWYGAAIATGGSAALTLTLGYYYLTRLIGPIRPPVSEFARQLGASVLMVVAVVSVRPFIPTYSHYATVAVVLFGAIVYALTLLGLSEYVRDKIRSLL